MPFDPRELYITTRVPLAISPAPRDYLGQQDARLINCYVEDSGNDGGLPYVSRRQGLNFVGSHGLAYTHGLYAWAVTGQLYVNADNFLLNGILGTGYGTTTFSSNEGHASYGEIRFGAADYLIITTDIKGYTLSTGHILTEITDPAWPGLQGTLVPGIVCMGGYIFIATVNGQIYNCDLSLPYSWNALGYLSADSYPDKLVALSRHLDYVVAFGETSTQFFYNAGNPAPGSPLSPVPNSQFQFGCAAAASVCITDNTIVWMAQTGVRGFSVMQMNGFQPVKISDAYIDRMLGQAMTVPDTNKITGYSVRMRGHTFYVLNVPAIDKTFVYDMQTQHWAEWRSVDLVLWTDYAGTLTIAPQDGAMIITAAAPHGLTTGNVVRLSGFAPAVYNVTAPVYVLDATRFTIPTMEYNTAVTDATGLWALRPNQMFVGRYATSSRSATYFARKNTEYIYALNYMSTNDFDLGENFPILMSIVTPALEAGKLDNKTVYALDLMADKPLSTTGAIIPVYISWSDNDYLSWTPFRIVPQNRIRSRLRRLGAGRRRAFWILYLEAREFRIQTLELTVERGDT